MIFNIKLGVLLMIYYYDKYSKYISFNKTTSFGFIKIKWRFNKLFSRFKKLFP